MAEAEGGRRIRRLDDRHAASVRASQVIGSTARAIEELVRNALDGGATSVVVTAGKDEINVSDDGTGIDPEAMRLFVGTEYCSSGSERDSSHRGLEKKGESLRSIAALCVEMTIETTSCEEHGIVRSDKVFREGAVVSSTQSSSGDASSAIIPMRSDAFKATKSGTTVTLRGLFHRHIVRRKHREKTPDLAEFGQIRTCLRLLALSHPHVEFTFKNGYSGKVDCSYKSPELAFSMRSSSSSKSSALVQRLCEMYPDEDFENSIELAYEETERKTSFEAFGALLLSEEADEDVRRRDLEMVLINGRLVTQNEKLSDVIMSQVKLCRGARSNCFVRFVIHVSSRSGELVVKDSVATISVPQIGDLAKFLETMVAKAMGSSEHSALYEESNWDSQGAAHESCWNLGGKKLVRGEHIMSSASKAKAETAAAGGKTESVSKRKSPAPSSPFSSAFFDAVEVKQPAQTKMKPNETKQQGESEPLSFEAAFLDETPQPEVSGAMDTKYDFESATEVDSTSFMWTKQRVKGLERTIAALRSDKEAGSGTNISLTREMLSKAEVIAQVSEKFINERVALEKLENALFNPDMEDNAVIRMTNKSMLVSAIVKPMKLAPHKRISMSQKDMATIKHHWTLLQKWKFSFEEVDDKTLLLTGLPSVCDRPSSVNDFLGFVKELGHFTGGNIKPAFVKNILASNACRYAIMFGDTLTHEKCVELIASLSRCKFCFICAHGRPSVIPLIEMNSNGTPHSTSVESAVVKRSNAFGPKRVIRRRFNGNDATVSKPQP